MCLLSNFGLNVQLQYWTSVSVQFFFSFSLCCPFSFVGSFRRQKAHPSLQTMQVNRKAVVAHAPSSNCPCWTKQRIEFIGCWVFFPKKANVVVKHDFILFSSFALFKKKCISNFLNCLSVWFLCGYIISLYCQTTLKGNAIVLKIRASSNVQEKKIELEESGTLLLKETICLHWGVLFLPLTVQVDLYFQ